MNDNAAHNDNNTDSISVLVRAMRDGRIGFTGNNSAGAPIDPSVCAKVIIAAAVAFNGNNALYDTLECFSRALEAEYGADKAKSWLEAMVNAHNAAAELLKPTTADILDA